MIKEQFPNRFQTLYNPSTIYKALWEIRQATEKLFETTMSHSRYKFSNPKKEKDQFATAKEALDVATKEVHAKKEAAKKLEEELERLYQEKAKEEINHIKQKQNVIEDPVIAPGVKANLFKGVFEALEAARDLGEELSRVRLLPKELLHQSLLGKTFISSVRSLFLDICVLY
eukprot:Gb_30359 [translate_table: standard]